MTTVGRRARAMTPREGAAVAGRAGAGATSITGVPVGQHGRSPGELVVPDRLMTIDEVAAYTQLSKHTLYKLRAQGQGPRAARLGKHLRYRRSDVDAWIVSRLDDVA